MPKKNKKGVKKPRTSNSLQTYNATLFGIAPWAPPDYSPETVVKRMFRFTRLFNPSSARQIDIITPAKLCALQAICTVLNTTAVPFYDWVKVRRVELMCSASTGGSIIGVNVLWPGATAGTFGSGGGRASQTSGTTVGAKACSKPDRLSQAAQFQPGDTVAGANQVFSLTYGASTNDADNTLVTLTCDVYVTFRMPVQNRVTNNTVPVTVATLGGFYYLPLDNKAGGTGAVGENWTPDPTVIQTI